ncbi:hypothetical protein G7Y89_g4962 [Cudoniella acicularis]|uniref:Ubiquitin-like domain-containing protein n=1 Tax=Cudoniella acicularis TaxID=354080 RepID=A0A8H4RQK9_9HELO|nr:hypothetical protein G7Y89_g4962 [Cudoniella acicularis]
MMKRLTLRVEFPLPENLRKIFQELLRPELIAILRDNLLSLNPKLLENYEQRQANDHKEVVSKMSENYADLSSARYKIKRQMDDSNLSQERIECCLRGHCREVKEWRKLQEQNSVNKTQGLSQKLPYEYFRSFKVLKEFIEHEFKDLSGSVWDTKDRYMISSFANNRVLDESTWSVTVVPGTEVATSIVVRRYLDASSNARLIRCPEGRGRKSTQTRGYNGIKRSKTASGPIKSSPLKTVQPLPKPESHLDLSIDRDPNFSENEDLIQERIDYTSYISLEMAELHKDSQRRKY